MPILSSRATASVRSFGLMIISAITSVIDTFNRANQSGLGKIKGQTWKIWRGTWDISSNKASSSTSPSFYPLASLNFTKTDASVSVSGAEPGMGLSFWISDADNWWAATYEQVYSCSTCQGCSAYNPIACCAWNTSPGNCSGIYNPGGSCKTWNTSGGFYAGGSSCTSWNKQGGNQYQGGNCIPKTTPPVGFCSQSYNPIYYNPVSYPCATSNPFNYNPISYPCNAWNPAGNCIFNSTSYPCSGNCYTSSCSSPFFFTCNCATTHKVNLLKMIASTVSNVASTTFSSAIASFRAILSGNNVTIKAYSDSSWTTQIGSDWNNSATSPVKTKTHGIIKAPSTYAQGSAIDEFRVT